MTPEKRQRRGIFRGLWNWFLRLIGDAVPAEDQLQAHLNTMVDALDAKARAASMAVALADKTRSELTAALADFDTYHDEAKNFMSAGDEDGAKRCLLLQREAEGQVTRLTDRLREQQENADMLAAEYAQAQAEVRRRQAEMPQLKADARIAEAEALMQEAGARENLREATEGFDAAVGELDVRRKAARARAQLERDPVEEMRQEVKDITAARDLQDSLAALRQEVAAADDTADDPKLIEHQPVEDARALLEAPRFRAFAKTKLTG